VLCLASTATFAVGSDANNPGISISGQISSNSTALCIGHVAPLVATLNWPATFTDHPVPGRYSFESQVGLQIDVQPTGNFNIPPGSIEVVGSTDTATIYMKGTQLGVFKPSVSWKADSGKFSMPSAQTSINVNPYVTGTTKVLQISPPSGSSVDVYTDYSIGAKFGTHLVKCNKDDLVQFRLHNVVSSFPEGGLAEHIQEFTIEPGTSNFDLDPDLLAVVVINKVSGPHLTQAQSSVQVIFTNPTNPYPFVISDTHANTLTVRPILPQ
jgi:hypothetical protein